VEQIAVDNVHNLVQAVAIIVMMHVEKLVAMFVAPNVKPLAQEVVSPHALQ